MSTLTAIYLQRRYLECPSITPFTSTAIALHGATDSRATRYNLNHEPNRSPHHFAIDTKHVHQEYDDNHHRREETTSLFHSDYRENYLP
ncbi:hypothetical protein BS17DRAFT_185549 [Gyrodon lividus]|nr:hypothetical protein BS17DRAFT_185549 [Gyrodon lividus]